MARQKIYTDHVFSTEDAAWKYVTEHYSVEKNYIMKNAKKAGKKVSVGVEKRKKSVYVIVIYID